MHIMVGDHTDLFDLRDRGIVIAGAGGGLARAIVRTLSGAGARLFLIDIDAERLNRIEADAAGAAAQQADVTDAAALDRAMAAASAHLGRVDGAVNAAGVLPIAPAASMAPADFRACLDLNVTGAFLFSRAAAVPMRSTGGGSIVHLASVSSFVANRDYAAYASSKGGLAQLIRVLAREWAGENIRVNGIGPALTDTPLTHAYLADAKFRAQAVAAIPMGRLGQPEDIVATVLLLLASGGAFITGQIICPDGGRTLV